MQRWVGVSVHSFKPTVSRDSGKSRFTVTHGIGTSSNNNQIQRLYSRSRKMESQLGFIEQSFNSNYTFWVREALEDLPDNFTITDPRISGHPIVFASRGFLKMIGYSENEVIGRNGRIFQGQGTSRRSVMEIREAIREERTVQINLLNYRKDGTPFWMLLHMCPVFSEEDGRVVHFVGVQVPISKKPGQLGSGSLKNGVKLCQEIVYGSCRKEVCSDALCKLNPILSLDSASDSDFREFEIEEPCEASDLEKRSVATTMDNILSVLTHYSKSIGRLVSGKRCNLSGVGILSSSLNNSLGRIKQSFVLTDPNLPDMPIVYASDAFLRLTGYSRNEILGRNCRFLCGKNTDSATSYQIMESISMKQPCTVHILNYRKDKSSFWNFLHISPTRNASGKIAYFVSVQMEEGLKNQDGHGLSPAMRHCSIVGAVKVAVRSSSIGAGSSNT